MVLPKYLLAVLAGIHWYSEYLKYGIAEVSISGTFGYPLVFELPKSGNFKVSISGAFEYPLAFYPLDSNVFERNE